jgi:hypothetical protein
MNYKSTAMQELSEMVVKYPDYTLGEIFYSFLRPKHLNGKHLVEASDEEIYTSLERALTSEEDRDEKLTDEEFKNWIETK